MERWTSDQLNTFTTYLLVSWESEATPSATPFFKRAYKISHFPRLWASWVDLPSFATSSKIWPNFSNKVVEKLMLSKSVNNKKCAPKLIFFNEKKIEKDSDNFWHRKLTLKVRNCHFSIAWFRAEVDLTKNLFYEKVLFFTQLTSHLMSSLLKKS